jgi:hypothetical protein
MRLDRSARDPASRGARHHLAAPAAALLALLALGAAPPVATSAQTAERPVARHGDTSGFLYGEAVTRAGNTYRGRLRWGDEEASWGDHFNGSRAERPYYERAPRHMRGERGSVRIFGIEIGTGHHDEGRQLAVPFGAIRELAVHRGERVTVVMKSGARIELAGGSNDIGADVVVWDAVTGRIALDWDELERVRFLPTPPDLAVDERRLHGTVKSEGGTFRGWIQWDQDECLSGDELDGDTDDGDLSIAMGRIARIERASRRASRVVLTDGRELRLHGSNDVDADNRGIFVEDERVGRVLVGWDAFESVTFDEPRESGPTYSSFAAGAPLAGTVTLRDGSQASGRIVYDLDESEGWDLLSGTYGDVEYYLAFAEIAAIVPTGDDAARVTLRNGRELLLEDSADVGAGNDGLAVLAGDDDERVRWIEWEDVRRIDFR